MHHTEETVILNNGEQHAKSSPTGRLSNASRFLSSMTPKSLSKFSAERAASTASPNLHVSISSPNMDTLVAADADRSPSPVRGQRHSNASAVSDRSNSTISNDSGVSDGSQNSAKRSSWTRSLLAGMRSKSSGSLHTLDAETLYVECDAPAVPNCLQGHELYLRRILQATQKNVTVLLVRTQHTEADVLQMVAKHCNHRGCRRKLINAAMRNLEKRIIMLNKYRDAILRFVITKHQEFVQSLPAKKAEADALFELCQRNGKECMRLANEGASQSGTLLVAIYNRLHSLQTSLNNSPDELLSAPNAPSRSLSALSIHSHGEGETEDYVMTVVPTVPQAIPLKLCKPAKGCMKSIKSTLHAPQCPQRNNTNGHSGSEGLTSGPCCSPSSSPSMRKSA